jgi:hypothetical protein
MAGCDGGAGLDRAALADQARSGFGTLPSEVDAAYVSELDLPASGSDTPGPDPA